LLDVRLEILHYVDLWLVQLLLLLLFLNRVTDGIAFWLSGCGQTSDLMILLIQKLKMTIKFFRSEFSVDWFIDLMFLALIHSAMH